MNKELLKSKYLYLLIVLVLLTVAGIIGCGILYYRQTKPIQAEEESEQHPEFINQIKISKTIYTLPMQVQEFEDCGFFLKEEDANTVLKPYEYGTYNYYDEKDYLVGSIEVRNYSTMEQTIHDCKIIALDMDAKHALPVEWYKGIDFYSTSSEVFQIYGKPDSEHIGALVDIQYYEWEKDGYSIKVELEKDKIHSISILKEKM